MCVCDLLRKKHDANIHICPPIIININNEIKP